MAIVVSTGAPKVPHNSPEQIEKRRLTRALIKGGAIILVLLFGLLLRALAWEGVMVTSGSMEPLLRKDDYTLVDHRVVLGGTWARGDVIVFESPASWPGGEETLVKRVIGLPGETVALSAGQVSIDGAALREDYLLDAPDPQSMAPFRLGTGEYFVMGDNRNNSSDSRENGPISEERIRGKILMKLWPFPRFGSLGAPNYGDN